MAAEDSAGTSKRTLGRFALLRRIGAGGMGVVYEALDQVHGNRVALKTLDHLEPEAIYRLKSEFRSLAGVLHHNLVQMHELACDGDAWFFVMDYIEGQPFLNHLLPLDTKDAQQISAVEFITEKSSLKPTEEPPPRRSSSPPPHPGPDQEFYRRLRDSLSGLLDGVQQIHTLGKLHRDLKPSNVLVTEAGRVVILDFGLTTDLKSPRGVPQDRSARGTPLYMAPELFLGEPATAASDLYAVGVMLYQALVGRPPFGGASHQLVSEKLYSEITPPSEIAIGTPGDLSQACVALLRTNPSDRPGIEALRALLEEEPAQSEIPPSDVGSRPAGSPPRFVGRKRELARIEAIAGLVRSGSTALVTLTGESGLGKTALVSEFLAREQASRAPLVLSSRCYEHESVPYKAFDQIADQLSSHLRGFSDEDLAEFLPEGALALVTLFPVLARVPSLRFGSDQQTPADPTNVRLRALAALRELLRRLASKRPIILTIDDLQWSDHDSALVFKELFRKEDAPPLLALLTSRTPSPEVLSPLLSELARHRNHRLHVETLALSPLAATDALTLARGALGSTTVDQEDANAIVLEAKGNPFFLIALSRRRTQHEDSPVSLPSFMQGWLRSLPLPALRLLQVVAIAGQPLDEAALSAVLPDPNVGSLLFLLSRDHFIGAWPTPNRRVECYHDRIREAVVLTLTPQERRRLHSELGEVLEGLGGADAETLANHFLEAELGAKGARYAERAADEAALAFAFFHAAHYYERALRHVGDPKRRVTLKAKLGEAYACAGNGRVAAEHLLEAADDSPETTALKLRQRAAELLLVCGHIDRGVQTLDVVLDHIHMSLAKSPRRALLSLVGQRARVKLRGLSFVSRPPHELEEGALLKIDACWSVALGLSLVDPVRAADFQTRNLVLSLNAGDPYRVARALAMEAGFVATGGSRSERQASRLSQRALALAKEVGNPHAIGLATFTAGLARYLVGDWRAAVLHFDEAESLLVKVPGAIWELNAAQRFRINSQTFMGDLQAIRTSVPELLQAAVERGNLYSECALRVRGDTMILLAADCPEKALLETEEMMTRWSQDGFHLQHYNAMWARCLCYVYLGDADSAMTLIRETWPRLEASLLTNTQALRVESRFLRGRVCLAYLGKYPGNEESKKLLDKDIRALFSERVAWATAFGNLLCGLRHADTDQLSATALLARAETELAAGAMSQLAQIARYRRGQLIGGEDGRQLMAEATADLLVQGVENPERFMEQWAPMNAAPQPRRRPTEGSLASHSSELP